MPQQNWREELKQSSHWQVFSNTFTPEQQEWWLAFIETLLARVIDEIPDFTFYADDGEELHSAGFKQALKAKYLTQLRSGFGIEDGR